MSRVGNAPIDIPQGVEVSVNNGTISVKGPKGELSQEVDTSAVAVNIADTRVSTTTEEAGETSISATSVAPSGTVALALSSRSLPSSVI